MGWEGLGWGPGGRPQGRGAAYAAPPGLPSCLPCVRKDAAGLHAAAAVPAAGGSHALCPPPPRSIREKAELKLYSALGRQAKRKRQHMGDLKIVVAGCVAAQEGQALLRRVPEVDLVMGPHHANRWGRPPGQGMQGMWA